MKNIRRKGRKVFLPGERKGKNAKTEFTLFLKGAAISLFGQKKKKKKKRGVPFPEKGAVPRTMDPIIHVMGKKGGKKTEFLNKGKKRGGLAKKKGNQPIIRKKGKPCPYPHRRGKKRKRGTEKKTLFQLGGRRREEGHHLPFLEGGGKKKEKACLKGRFRPFTWG